VEKMHCFVRIKHNPHFTPWRRETELNEENDSSLLLLVSFVEFFVSVQKARSPIFSGRLRLVVGVGGHGVNAGGVEPLNLGRFGNSLLRSHFVPPVLGEAHGSEEDGGGLEAGEGVAPELGEHGVATPGVVAAEAHFCV